VSRPALGPTQPPIQWVPGALSLGVKRPEREADHSSPTSAEVSAWSYTSTPQYALMAWRSINEENRDTFTFTLLLSLCIQCNLKRVQTKLLCILNRTPIEFCLVIPLFSCIENACCFSNAECCSPPGALLGGGGCVICFLILFCCKLLYK
jgi:hypothetical protein